MTASLDQRHGPDALFEAGAEAGPVSPLEGHRSDIELIGEDGALRATRLPGQGYRLVVVFNSIGGAREFDRQDEFLRTLVADPRNRPIFLTDLRKGWFASGSMMETVRATVEAEASRAGVSEIVSLGSSMGGFAALALAGVMPVHATLAFAPRYSPDDRVVPDKRLVAHREALGPFNPQTVEAGLHASPFSVVVHGLQGRDRHHVLRFPALPGMHHYLVPGVAHAVAAHLREAGLLGEVLTHAFARDAGSLDDTMLKAEAFSRLVPSASRAATGSGNGMARSP